MVPSLKIMDKITAHARTVTYSTNRSIKHANNIIQNKNTHIENSVFTLRYHGTNNDTHINMTLSA